MSYDKVKLFFLMLSILSKNTEALLVASKEFGVQVVVDTTEHMIMSGDQNVRQNHSVKTDNKYFVEGEGNSSNIWEQP
jgi:predicted ATPase